MRRPHYTAKVGLGLLLMERDALLLGNADRTKTQREALKAARKYAERMIEWHEEKHNGKEADDADCRTETA